uniref:ATP synthase F(0) complex subunit e, mitochondrial n=1 Tax=Amphimedon queenslandica TaxID=400682 RepID=A0A1X7VRI9_AMPQE
LGGAQNKISKMPVSSLIKFSRYSALTVGLAYGYTRNKRLVKKEAALKAQEAAKKGAGKK